MCFRAHRDRAINSRAPKLSQNASLQQESSGLNLVICGLNSPGTYFVTKVRYLGQPEIEHFSEFEICRPANYSYVCPIHIIRFFENFENFGF